MAKKTRSKSILTKDSLTFLERYLNNPSPTGFESEGQKLWLDYMRPYVDEHIVDNYGTVVGVINPTAITAAQMLDTMVAKARRATQGQAPRTTVPGRRRIWSAW